MTRFQRQLAVFVGLVMVMVAVYVRALGPRAPRTPRPVVAEEAATPPASQDPAAGASATERSVGTGDVREAQREHAAALTWRRDPFTRGGSAAGVRGLTLSGIIWDPLRPIAILNDQMVSVGDEVEDYQVLEIGTDRVLLTDGAETIQLLINP
jgi:hypothetical protein